MSIKYICDRCGSEHDEGTDVFYVKLNATQAERGRYSSYPESHMKTAMWCGDCIKATIGRRPTKENDAPEPTFEDMIRDLVREEVQSAVEGR